MREKWLGKNHNLFRGVNVFWTVLRKMFTDFGEIVCRRSPYNAIEYLWDSWESMKWQLYFNYRNKLYFVSIFYMFCPIPIKSGRADVHSCWLCFMNIGAANKFLSAIITFIFWFGWNALQVICILCSFLITGGWKVILSL